MWSFVCGIGRAIGDRRPHAVPLLEDRRDHRHRDLGPVLVVAGDEDDVRGPRAVAGGACAPRHTPTSDEQRGRRDGSWLGAHGWETAAAAGRTSMTPFIVRQWAGNVQTNG